MSENKRNSVNGFKSENGFEWPFDVWLKTAVRGFGLSPSQFWKMSVRDWLALLAGHAEQRLGREGLNTLMKTYPDDEQKREKHD